MRRGWIHCRPFNTTHITNGRGAGGLGRKNAMDGKGSSAIFCQGTWQCVPDWSHDCRAAGHQERVTVAAAVPQLLPSPQTERESPCTCTVAITTAPERRSLHWYCHHHWSQHLGSTTPYSHKTIFPAFELSLFSTIPGPGRRFSCGSFQTSCLCFPQCRMGGCIRTVTILPVFRDCTKYCPWVCPVVNALLWVKLSPSFPCLLLISNPYMHLNIKPSTVF